MSSYPATEALRDIRDNARLAQKWIGERTADDLEADTQLYYAVVRCLQIISEAAARLPADLKARHDLPWRQIEDAGNAYRHAYHRLQAAVILETAGEPLSKLLKAVDAELDS